TPRAHTTALWRSVAPRRETTPDRAPDRFRERAPDGERLRTGTADYPARPSDGRGPLSPHIRGAAQAATSGSITAPETPSYKQSTRSGPCAGMYWGHRTSPCGVRTTNEAADET